MAILYLYLDANADPHPGTSRNNEAEFGRIAVALASSHRADARSFQTGQNILDIIAQYNRIERLVIFAHGHPEGIGWSERGSGGGIHDRRRAGGYLRTDAFALAVASRLAPNTIVGLAACSCGSSQTEYDRAKALAKTRSSEAFGLVRADAAGVGSFAYNLRDKLMTFGARGVEVRAHVWSGHTTRNPWILTFSSPPRSPGVALIRTVSPEPTDGNRMTWFRDFNRRWNGDLAQEYIIGGPAPDNISAGPAYYVAPTFATRGSSSSVIPSRRGNNMDNSEGTYNSNGQVIVPSNLPTEDEIMTSINTWGIASRNRLNGH